MDLDAFVMAHQHEWSRLQELSGRRRLSGAESDELLDLYQRTATHLSMIRSSAPDVSVVQYLSTLLARTRQRTSGVRTTGWADLARFFTDSFPAALYRARRWWITVALLNVAVALVIGIWVARNPSVQTGFIPADRLNDLVNHDFEDYYSEFAAQDFAARVWTNNAWVTAQCIVLGVLGVPVVYVLWSNVVNLGVMGGIMAGHDRAGHFFGLILPHGLLELTAVFVAGGVGLKIFWSWVEPGPRTRMQSLAAEARAGVGIALGLVVVLFGTGVIEAFVTPSGLPTWARVGIGVLVEVAFLTYVFTLGRWAAQRGETGDIGELDRGDVLPSAA
ncbi:stage II sporulation protein M [Luteipulveratus flavus]|uniref:Stage II sporulation protein M n=1 Tax=Luteipulveratus flavus TaxID=3031728 RepID=A0ABT6C2R7_9MICO|nr:stage II sporulation protein M [Luteipulveratus sp. YIM 133296]MDF8263063.1 stage II sporulation protein M [Luteipulveratus sp. YIM 133296]